MEEVLLAEYGVASREMGPIDTATRFPLGCVARAVMAIAIALGVESEAEEYDLPINAYRPRSVDSAATAGAIRQLLTYAAGVRFAGLSAGRSGVEHLIENIPGWAARARCAYDGEGGSWALLGRVCEGTLGRSLEDCYHCQLLWLLGMRQTVFTLSPNELTDPATSIALPHVGTDDLLSLLGELRRNGVRFDPANSGWGTMRDACRPYEILLLAKNRSISGPFQGSSAACEIVRVQRSGLLDEVLGTRVDWGLGFAVDGRLFGPGFEADTFGYYGPFGASLIIASPARGMVLGIAFAEIKEHPRTRFMRLANVLQVLKEDCDSPGMEMD